MLRRFYWAAKAAFNTPLRWVVNRAEWLDELANEMQHPALRRAVQGSARKLGDIGHFLIQLPRLDVVRVTGEPGSVIYVGDADTYKLSLLKALFNNQYEEEFLGRVALWKLPARTHQWLTQTDLVIIRVSRFYPWRIRTTYAFNNALRVYQMVPLDKAPEEMLAGSSRKRLREHVNRINRANITTRPSRSDKDLEFFYHRMYAPTMLTRHTERAVVAPYAALERVYKTGFLWFLVLDGQDVAASLCYMSRDGRLFTGAYLGYLDGKTERLKQDLGVALYWHSMLKAREQGATTMNIMESVAWVTNGVYSHKQKWGARPHPDPYNHQQLLFRANHLCDAWRVQLNNIGFLTCENGNYMRVYVDESETSAGTLAEDAVRHGLDGIQIVTANGRTNIFA